jgi:hypothetical protein
LGATATAATKFNFSASSAGVRAVMRARCASSASMFGVRRRTASAMAPSTTSGCKTSSNAATTTQQLRAIRACEHCWSAAVGTDAAACAAALDFPTTRAFYEGVKRQGVPCAHRGRRLLFLPADLDRAIGAAHLKRNRPRNEPD